MTAYELPAAFSTVPAAWRACVAGWDATAEQRITAAVAQRSGEALIGPPDPFRALRLVAPEAVHVVIIGQDPYPGPGQADGLAFSAPTSSRPSLRRIFDVLEADRPGWRRPASGRLDGWAAQGVLLLNPVLTVQLGKTNSHARVGWQALTGALVRGLARRADAPAFLLWGRHAQEFFATHAAGPGDGRRTPLVLRTRHPAHDFDRAFMAEGSHFRATADRVDWWSIGTTTPSLPRDAENVA